MKSFMKVIVFQVVLHKVYNLFLDLSRREGNIIIIKGLLILIREYIYSEARTWVNRIIACFYLFSGAVASKGLQFIMHAAHLLAINAGICLSESLLEFVEVRIHEASSLSVLLGPSAIRIPHSHESHKFMYLEL